MSLNQPNLTVRSPNVVGTGYAPRVCDDAYGYSNLECDFIEGEDWP